MNKLSLILLALFVGFASANAQIEDDGFGQKSATPKTGATKPAGKQINVKTKNYNYELSVGARVGGGMTRMSEGDGLKFTDGSGLSFGGGLAANIRFGGKDSRGRALDGQGLLGAALELNYKYSSVKTLGEKDLKMGYFEVPILFQIYPCYNTKQLKNLYVEVGPTIAGTLSSSPETIQVGNSIYHTGDIKGFDVKATVGVWVIVSTKLLPTMDSTSMRAIISAPASSPATSPQNSAQRNSLSAISLNVSAQKRNNHQ